MLCEMFKNDRRKDKMSVDHSANYISAENKRLIVL